MTSAPWDNYRKSTPLAGFNNALKPQLKLKDGWLKFKHSIPVHIATAWSWIILISIKKITLKSDSDDWQTYDDSLTL